MLELIAQGKQFDSRWRKALFEGEPVNLGRTAKGWATGWDDQISRQHVRVELVGDQLNVQKLPEASNPVYFNGSEQESFVVKPGEHFVIGQTTFTLTNDVALATLDLPNPISQRAFSGEYLRQVRYRDADRRISVLNRLPDIISSSPNETELLSKLVNLLMIGIPSATAVAVCQQADDGNIVVVHWDRRQVSTGDFQPSARLIAQSLERGESTLHMWRSSATKTGYTMDLQNDWAFVCPLTGTASKGWSIYVTGKNRGLEADSSDEDLQGDVKFTELVGATLANLRRVRQLERRQSSLRPFFSPIVLDAFADREPDEVLAPRECIISVLFCDLRGFSAKTEEMSGQLKELLDRVSKALGMMTRTVLSCGGVIGDFHGDSAMGFWGWPLERDDSATLACRAALDIHKQLEQIAIESDHPLRDFRMGLGIATGPAVAGKIGTSDQVKVTAFGPPVNLAARLEGMTGQIGLPILIDGETAKRLDSNKRIRALGTFLPFGLTTPSKIFALIPTDAEIRVEWFENYSQALDLLAAGKWSEALEILKRNFASDPASRFLGRFIERHHAQPPPNWKGYIELSSK